MAQPPRSRTATAGADAYRCACGLEDPVGLDGGHRHMDGPDRQLVLSVTWFEGRSIPPGFPTTTAKCGVRQTRASLSASKLQRLGSDSQ